MDILLFSTCIIAAVTPSLHGNPAGVSYYSSCTFTANDTCGYRFGPRWELHMGPYMLRGFLVVLSGGQDDHYFALFDTAPPIDKFNSSLSEQPVNTTYDLTSPEIPAGAYTLKAWIQLLNPASRLDVFTRTSNGAEHYQYSISGRNAPWQQLYTTVGHNQTFQVVFRAHVTYVGGSMEHAVVAVDRVSVEGTVLTTTTTTTTPPTPPTTLKHNTPPTSSTWSPQKSTGSTQPATTASYVTSESNHTATLEELVVPRCSNSGWNISVDLAGVQQIYPHASRANIFFGDTSCSGTLNGRFLMFEPDLHGCLTTQKKSGDNIIYENDLFYAIFDPDNPFIIRQHGWTYSVECDVRRNIATSTHIHHDIESHHVSIAAKYDVKLSFYRDPNFNEVLPGNPIHMTVGQNVYVKVYTTTADWTIKMHVHTCYTKPNDGAPDTTKYFIIKNGCEVDRNTHLMSQSTHETRFMFQDFEYASNHEGLNIYCDATFCNSMDFSSDCMQICNPGQG